jgi:hypothetical protein
MNVTRIGKIGRLPKAIREELNRKLDDGAAGPPLLEWLNALPGVQLVLRDQFDSQPISEQNLSAWRLGGFLDWERNQEARVLARALLEETDAMDDEGNDTLLSDRFSALMAITLARLIREVMTFAGNPDREKSILRIARELSRLRRDDHAMRRLHMKEDLHQYQMREVRDATVDRDLQRGLSFSGLAQAMGAAARKPEEKTGTGESASGNREAETRNPTTKGRSRRTGSARSRWKQGDKHGDKPETETAAEQAPEAPSQPTQPARQHPPVPTSDFPPPTSPAPPEADQGDCPGAKRMPQPPEAHTAERMGRGLNSRPFKVTASARSACPTAGGALRREDGDAASNQASLAIAALSPEDRAWLRSIGAEVPEPVAEGAPRQENEPKPDPDYDPLAELTDPDFDPWSPWRDNP